MRVPGCAKPDELIRFSPERFRRAREDLSKAVYELSEELMLDRLHDKLTRASGVAKRAADKIEARADALIARENAIDSRTDEVFGHHDAILGEASAALDTVEAALNLMGNGGPPLIDVPKSVTSPEPAPSPVSPEAPHDPPAIWARLGA